MGISGDTGRWTGNLSPKDMRVSRVAFQEARKQAKAACQAGVGNATKWVSMEGCRKGKRDQPIL